MKYLLSIALLFFCATCFAQTTTVPIDTFIVKDDSLAVNLDGIAENDINFTFFGFFDSYSIQANAINLSFGFPVGTYVNRGTSIAGATLGCEGVYPKPNKGFIYIDYVRLNAAADTTFGYIKTDFRGDTTQLCGDTLFIYQSVYSTVSNQHIVTGIKPIIKPEFNIYPNPGNGIFNFISLQAQPAQLIITNLVGQGVYNGVVTGSKSTVDISRQPKGIYFYRMQNGNNVLQTGKIIVE